jgi:hypothetical protein
MVRQRQLWHAAKARDVKVPEYIDVPLLYRDIGWLFGSVLSRSSVTYNVDPIDAFSSLILLRGDDYAQQLSRCTIETLWRCFFESGRELAWFVESPTRDARHDANPVQWLAQPLTLRLHFAPLRAFVNRAYDLSHELRWGPPKPKPIPKKAKPDHDVIVKRPAGWPSDQQLQVMAANLVWNLDNLCNGWRYLCVSENELQTQHCSVAGAPLSFYGWERRRVDGGNKLQMCYAERVVQRNVFEVTRGTQPVDISKY